MLTTLMLINDALTAALERPTFNSASHDVFFLAFVNQECAFKFLHDVLSVSGKVQACWTVDSISVHFSDSLAPLHKWLQAIYLTAAGTIPVSPDNLGGILDVPRATASAMLQMLTSSRHGQA